MQKIEFVEFTDDIYGFRFRVNIGANSDDTELLPGTNEIVINLKSLFSTPEDLGVLSHEVFHAAFYIFLAIGARLSEDSEECFAYFLEYLTVKILSLYGQQ